MVADGSESNLWKPVYTANDVKKLLDIGDNTFRRWIRNGLISYSQVPGSSKIYIQHQHLLDFLNDKTNFYPKVENVA
ncbi:MAG: helix-turn-helix domain-containing protein [Bacteroidales bacterium]|nr:helix-turn-helix domain-containing protein [Bacteroidales bacterium]